MLPENLSQLVSDTYATAAANGHVQFTESATNKFKDPKTGIQYVVSYAPSLLKKPERADQEAKASNPFEKPEPELTVSTDITGDGEYKLLLNKFPVVPEHVLLVTNEYKQQTSPLSPKDLITAYSLLDKLDDEDEDVRHMAFYNCGPSSGSSLDHKHLQLLKLPQKFTPFQDRLCNGRDFFLPDVQNEPLQDNKVAFSHFVVPLPEESSKVDEDTLAMVYAGLLQRALTFFQNWTDEKPRLSVGYNFMMTKRWVCMVPRSAARSDEQNIGFNATGYVGLVLVKYEETLKNITENPHLIDEVLLECGFPNTAGQKPTEYHY